MILLQLNGHVATTTVKITIISRARTEPTYFKQV